MNWNHLYCFYEVAKYRSIKDASKNLSLAASTVSEHVKSLESNINTTLLIRSPKDLKLTTDGERIFRYAEKMFSTGKRLEDFLTTEGIAGYNVKVGIEKSLRGEFVDNLLQSYWSNYSKFGLVETSNVKNSSQSVYFLDHDIIDIAISDFQINDSNYGQEKIASFRNSIFISNSIKVQPSKYELSRLPLAVLGNKEVMKKSLKSFLTQNSFSPREIFYTDHEEFAKKLCVRGEALLFMSHEKDQNISQITQVKEFEPHEYSIYSLFKKEHENLIFLREFKKEVVISH